MRMLEYRFSHFWIIALCGMFSACATHVSQPEIDTAIEATLDIPPEQWVEDATSAAVEIGWIGTFADSALTELVQEAQSNNRDLRAASADVERARALAVQAGAALTPSVDLGLGAAYSGGPRGSTPNTTDLTLGLQLGWEADVWGRIRAGSAGALASAQAVEADYRFARHSLAANTAKAYFAAIEARLQTGVVRKSLSSLEETLRIVQLRYDNGMTSAQDLALARSDLATVRGHLLDVESARRDAVRALELLLGRYPSAELDLRTSLPEAPPHPPAGVPSEILERRPDLVAAERRVAAAFNLLDQAKAAKLPALSLTTNVGGASNSLTSVLDPQNIVWQLTANLLAPIFDGGQRQAQVDIATADQKQALDSYAKVALDAFSQVESALDQGVVLEQRATELRIALQQANKAYRVAQIRYREGEVPLLDLLALQQRVDSASGSLLAVNRLLLEQRVNLHLALGGSWEE
ncbi:MAG: TolC family protein [Desulfuromonas sp.]|nr:TolC family protein [Desulfuromonas sp.]